MTVHRTKTLAVVSLVLSLSLACSLTSRQPATSTPAAPAPTTPAVSPTAPPSPTATQPPTATAPPPTATPLASLTAPAATETSAADAIQPLADGAPVTLVTLTMLDAAQGWAVGQGEVDDNHHILRTDDGGLTWADVSPPEPAVPAEFGLATASHFHDASLAWAAYYDAGMARVHGPARVWATRDGGQTWSASQPLDLSDVEGYMPTDIHFVDGQIGWLLAHVGAGMGHDYVVLFHTRDGGQTWERVADPFTNTLAMSCAKTGMGFLDASTGWVTGDCFGVAPGVYFQRTDDSGLNWVEQILPAPPAAPGLYDREDVGCGAYNLAIAPPRTVRLVVACTYFLENNRVENTLYASADGGDTWRLSAAPGRATAFLNDSLGWALSDGDVNQPAAPRQFWQTRDGGLSWDAIGTVHWSAQLEFVSENLGWAVAQADQDNALVRTADGGRTWQLLEPGVGD